MTPDNELNPLVGIVTDALIAQRYDFLVSHLVQVIEQEEPVPAIRYDLAEEIARTVLIALSDAPQVIAERFHEHYEVLAPAYNYETRIASSVPWRDVPEKNKKLMVATCATVFNV